MPSGVIDSLCPASFTARQPSRRKWTELAE
jgi:hypothetical protein